ncbi:hypothetical protein Lqui_0305 [Legionella quinlivanii]|uniref:Uncharacterized protein n=1 Tax=Legionella quinlivanii TaxID=45073 RepID=A0A0W0Y3T5_9GAMM|nr:hypothetical protein [Legionella quinlivanii]KTD51461.1 hypothetical protein Lqui_0305 [Legionella quinlivanii]SEG45155.1 hypothetical protein SAMN02746093_02998 [Legionella quinlivanii DSM 21216]STY11014.1 Uncharacterised protein [Legionella quinlivanii]
MPRYTAIHIRQAQHYRPQRLTREEIAQRIGAGDFSHEAFLDFPTEEEVRDVLIEWTMIPGIQTVMVRYELLNNDDYRILGFADIDDMLHYDFAEPPCFPSTYVRGLEGRRMQPRRPELPAGLVITPTAPVTPPVLLNTGQSTHTASVHKSVTESLQRLHHRYSRINIDANINAIKEFAKRITALNFPDTSQLEREAAIRFIARMDLLFNNKEVGSNLTIKHILALIWEAGHDQKTDALKCDIQTVEESFIKHLYEIQRGYNLDSQGRDLGDNDKPICVGGTINKLTDTLNAGIHDDVEIIYITRETASEKLKALGKEKAVEFVMGSSQKESLLFLIDQSKTADQIPTWDIPDLILDSIREEVKKSFVEEFESSLMPAVLEEIFSQFSYISFDEKNYNQMREEKSAVDKVVIDEKADIDEVVIGTNVKNSSQTAASNNSSSAEQPANQRVRLTAKKPSLSISDSELQSLESKPVQSRQKSMGMFGFFRGFNPCATTSRDVELPRFRQN